MDYCNTSYRMILYHRPNAYLSHFSIIIESINILNWLIVLEKWIPILYTINVINT